MIEYLFIAAGIIALGRAIRGPTFADRAISISSMISIIVFLMVFYSVSYGTEVYMDIAIILMLLSFVGSLAIAKLVDTGEEEL